LGDLGDVEAKSQDLRRGDFGFPLCSLLAPRSPGRMRTSVPRYQLGAVEDHTLMILNDDASIYLIRSCFSVAISGPPEVLNSTQNGVQDIHRYS
jgi:hypothetical protein